MRAFFLRAVEALPLAVFLIYMAVADPRADLAALLRRIRALLARPTTNLLRTPYNTVQEALDDFDSYIRDVESGTDKRLHELGVLFLPTSELQDLAIDSGWGDEFLEIADAYDAIMPALRKHRP